MHRSWKKQNVMLSVKTVYSNFKVSVSVKYLDNKSKMTQISQYELMLHKDNNWEIVG